jgi:hypothetical protein
MRLLKRQKGLPFLLALGVLFILSASFLAVQLWSDKYTMRGAVQALEAPVMPPAMPKIVAPPPVKKIARPQSATPELQPAEIKAEPQASAAVENVPVDINAAEVKIVTEAPVEKAPEKEAVSAPVVEKVKPVAAPVEKKVEKEEKAPKVGKKAEKQPKTVKKARKTTKTVEPVPTEIPAEWNWFSQPLKLSFDDGKAVIEKSENDKAISLSLEEKIRLETAVVEPATTSEEESQPADAVTPVAEPSLEKPFTLALAKMARIRQMRLQNSVVSEEEVVEAKAAELSPSLKAMGSILRELCEKFDKRQEKASNSLAAPEKTETVEVAVEQRVEAVEQDVVESAPEAETATTTEVEASATDLGLKPYYSGSGSSFSARIDSMLKQGLIKAE